MRLFGFFLALCLLAAAPQRATAEPGDDAASAIEAVIADQIAAFRQNALDRAFAHAAPSIQQKFRTPDVFGQMVEAGYPMIWRPARYEIMDLEQHPRGFVQSVMYQDAGGTLYEADYLMEQIDGTWRIAGVSLRKMPGTLS